MAMQDVCTHCHHKRENMCQICLTGGATVIFLIAIVTDLKIKNN